ncbi:MAG: ATP-binding cassette domain-containing protein [Desulfovibrionales bacterium]
MLRLNLSSVSHGFDGTDLFENIQLDLTPGMKLAVAGPNGCGKSTLLAIMSGRIIADRGNVSFPGNARIGQVLQELDAGDLKKTLLDYMLEVLPDWNLFWQEWKKAVNSGDNEYLASMADKQEEMEHRFGYSPEHEAERILAGLGFTENDFNQELQSLSGGWRERAKLARVLLEGADILFLDEPTNHLDLEAVLWLEEYLSGFQGILAFVAHDLYFVDKIATHVLYLGFDKYYFRPGGLTQFFKWHEEKEGYKQQQAEKLNAKINHKQSFVDRFRYKATKARQAQARIKQIESLQSELKGLRRERGGPAINFTWPEPLRCNKIPISGSGVSFAYDGNVLFQDLDFSFMRGQKIALVGPNGKGKSTLLKLMCGQIVPEKGNIRIGNNVRIGYYAQHQTEMLQENNNILDEVKRITGCTHEEEIRSVLGLFLLGEQYWANHVGSLSGGEKSRLVLSTLFLAKANVLLLDEPTNHLDMESREALVAALQDFSGTMILVAHDRLLLHKVAGEIWQVNARSLDYLKGGVAEYIEGFKKSGLNDNFKTDSAISEDITKSAKEIKRSQAERRNEIFQRLKPLQQEFKQLEDSLEGHLKFQEDIEKRLTMPETYKDTEKIKNLNCDLNASKTESESIFERMSRIEEEIEILQDERDFLKKCV